MTIFFFYHMSRVFLNSLSTALGGVNIKALLDDATLKEGGTVLLDFNDSMGDRIQVILE